jgi:hypothetical protein
MGLTGKVTGIMKSGGVSSHARPEPPGRAERAQTRAERARKGLAGRGRAGQS